MINDSETKSWAGEIKKSLFGVVVRCYFQLASFSKSSSRRRSHPVGPILIQIRHPIDVDVFGMLFDFHSPVAAVKPLRALKPLFLEAPRTARPARQYLGADSGFETAVEMQVKAQTLLQGRTAKHAWAATAEW